MILHRLPGFFSIVYIIRKRGHLGSQRFHRTNTHKWFYDRHMIPLCLYRLIIRYLITRTRNTPLIAFNFSTISSSAGFSRSRRV